MARGSGLNFAGLLVSQSATFVISLILARALGRTNLGIYAQAFAVLSLLQMVAMGGLHTGTMRFVAVNRAGRDSGAVYGTVLLGLGAAIGLASVLGLGLYLASDWMAVSVFAERGLAEPLRTVALALPPATFAGVALGATQGFKTMKASASIGLILEPALRVGLTVLFLALGRGVMGAMVALVISNCTAAILSARAIRRLLKQP